MRRGSRRRLHLRMGACKRQIALLAFALASDLISAAAFTSTSTVTYFSSSGCYATTKRVRVLSNRSADINRLVFLSNAHGNQELDDDFEAVFNDAGSIGHDYHPEPNAGPISCRFTEPQIHALLTKRLEYKRQRKFQEADLILVGLNKNGVYVNDKRKEWRADGQNHFGRQSRYVRRGGSYGLSDEDLVKVSAMVEDRAHAKRTRDYLRSDYLTDMLKQKYSVKVNDKKREWSVVVSNWDDNETNAHDANFSHMHYVPSPLAPPDDPTHTMDDKSKAYIQQRLLDRMAARKKKKYQKADRIRDELLQEYSIVIDDRTKEWKVVDNIEDDDFAREAQLSQRSAFIRRGGEGNKDIVSASTNANSMISEDNEDIQQMPIPTDDTTIMSPPAATDKSEDDKGNAEQQNEILNGLTVVVLKEKLRQKKLPVSGKKSELIDRLMDNNASD